MSREDKNPLSKLDLNTVQDIDKLRNAAIYWKEKYFQAIEKPIVGTPSGENEVSNNQKKQFPSTGLGGAVLK